MKTITLEITGVKITVEIVEPLDQIQIMQKDPAESIQMHMPMFATAQPKKYRRFKKNVGVTKMLRHIVETGYLIKERKISDIMKHMESLGFTFEGSPRFARDAVASGLQRLCRQGVLQRDKFRRAYKVPMKEA